MRETVKLTKALKRLIPAQLKRPAKAAQLSYIFGRGMQELRNLPPGTVPSRELLKKLRLGWDNQGWDAKLDYFDEIVRRAVATRGPILECGSGLTTLVLAHLCAQRNVETWVLEHNAQWHGRVSKALKRHGLPGVNLHLAPLRDYREFTWYDPPLSEMPSRFSLVICDGPPDLANGGRYGLLPILGERLESGAVILFDDADEPGQPEVLRRWAAERRVHVEMKETDEVSFAVVGCS